MWWFGRNDDSGGCSSSPGGHGGVANPSANTAPAAATSASAAAAPPTFSSVSEALHTCLDLRQLRSVSRLLGHNLSREQYEALLSSYEYLGYRALFWSAAVAYPVVFGLRWRRRRATRRLGENLQYWKGRAEAGGSAGAGGVGSAGTGTGAPVGPAPIAPISGPASAAPPGMANAAATRAASDFHREVQAARAAIWPTVLPDVVQSTPPREVFRPTAAGWIKTAVPTSKVTTSTGSTPMSTAAVADAVVVAAGRDGADTSAETRRVSSAQAKWARAFGGGAIRGGAGAGTAYSQQGDENADWEALAAQKAHEERWRKAAEAASADDVKTAATATSTTSETGTAAGSDRAHVHAPQMASECPDAGHSARAAKIDALLREDEDLAREQGNPAQEKQSRALPRTASHTHSATHNTESAKVYPTRDDVDFDTSTSAASTSFLAAALEHAAEEGRYVRETRLKGRNKTIRGGKYVLLHPSEMLEYSSSPDGDALPCAPIRSQDEGTERDDPLTMPVPMSAEKHVEALGDARSATDTQYHQDHLAAARADVDTKDQHSEPLLSESEDELMREIVASHKPEPKRSTKAAAASETVDKHTTAAADQPQSHSHSQSRAQGHGVCPPWHRPEGVDHGRSLQRDEVVRMAAANEILAKGVSKRLRESLFVLKNRTSY